MTVHAVPVFSDPRYANPLISRMAGFLASIGLETAPVVLADVRLRAAGGRGKDFWALWDFLLGRSFSNLRYFSHLSRGENSGRVYEEYCRNVPRWLPRLLPWNRQP